MLTGSAEGRTGESRENSFGFTTVVVPVVEVMLEEAPLALAGATTMVCVMGFGFFKRLCGCFG